MRRITSFPCEGCTLAATLDEAPGTSGLLIISGGNEIRIGAHRGMAMLAAEIAQAGYPVLRFDRRGIGDSDGMNGEFTSSAPDIAAAVAAFRADQPQLERIIAFGNCDGASALLLHQVPGIDALVLGNIWVIEPTDDLPPPAAIKARYLERMKDPKAWIGLFTGAIDLKKLASGLMKLAKPKAETRPESLPQRVADGLAAFSGPITILLAARDGVALAFAAEWKTPAFAPARDRTNIRLLSLDSDSHSFGSAEDERALQAALLAALKG